jgi:hypothetical protein
MSSMGTGQRWLWLVAGLIGLLVGILLGTRFAWLDSGPSGELPPTLGTIVLAIVLVAGLGSLALILGIRRGTRRVGQAALLAAAMIVAGWPLGVGIGPHYQLARQAVGRVDVTLAAPVAGSLSAEAVCTTADNSDRIQQVEAASLGRLGIDAFGLRLLVMDSSVDVTSAAVTLFVNSRALIWSRPLDLAERGPGLRSGRGTFTESVPDPFRIEVAAEGGPSRVVTMSGSVTWSCQPPAAGPAPTLVAPLSLVGNLQGWFVLHGLVEMPHPCEGPGGCLPYGSAFGACSDGQAESIDGIVPWVGGHRARLHLVPGPQAATLTVEVDDGSPPQTATAPPTLGEQPSGQTLAADFELPAGRLSLWVEWVCGGSR